MTNTNSVGNFLTNYISKTMAFTLNTEKFIFESYV
jgi:hypothetical protein